MDRDWGDVGKNDEVKFRVPEAGQDWTMEHALSFFISQGYKDEVELIKGKNIDISKLENYTNITPRVLLAMKLGVSALELLKSTSKAAEGSSGAEGNRFSAGANLDSGWGSSSNNDDRPRGGGGGGVSCFKCNETGHFARDCPNSDSNDGGRGGGRGGFGGGSGRGGNRSSFNKSFGSNNAADEDWGSSSSTMKTNPAEDNWDDPPSTNRGNTFGGGRGRGNDGNRSFGNRSFGGGSAANENWGVGGGGNSKTNNPAEDNWDDPPSTKRGDSAGGSRDRGRPFDGSSFRGGSRNNAAADDDWGSDFGTTANSDNWGNNPSPSSNSTRGRRGDGGGGKGWDRPFGRSDEPLDPNLSLDEIIRREKSKDRREGGWRYYSGHSLSGGERRSLGSRSESIADYDERESEADTVVKSTPERTVSTAPEDKPTLEGGKQNLIIKRFMEIANMDAGGDTTSGTALPPKVETGDNTQSTSTGKRTNDDNDRNDAPPVKRHRHQEDGNLEVDELAHQAESTFSSEDGSDEDSLIIDETNPSSDTTKGWPCITS